MTAVRSVTTRQRNASDDDVIARIVAAAFNGADETTLIEALRRDGEMLLEMVAELDGKIVGHVAYSKLQVEHAGRTLRAAALAPVAVAPSHQGSGTGGHLIRASLAALGHAGIDLVVVLGHKTYYPRFGFSSLLAKQLEAPYAGESFMALELKPGCLAGLSWKVKYARAFSP